MFRRVTITQHIGTYIISMTIHQLVTSLGIYKQYATTVTLTRQPKQHAAEATCYRRRKA